VHNVSSMKVTTDATQDCIHLKRGEFFAQRNAKSTTCGYLELLNSFQIGESMSGYFQI